MAVRPTCRVHFRQVLRIGVRLLPVHEAGAQRDTRLIAADELFGEGDHVVQADDEAGDLGRVLGEQIRRREQQVEGGVQVLLVLGQHGVRRVGQPRDVEQHGIQVVLFVDDGGAGGRRVVEHPQQIRCGVGVHVGDLRRLRQIFLQLRQTRIHLRQVAVALLEQGAEFFAASAQRRGDGTERGVELLRLHLSQYVGQVLEDRVELDGDVVGGDDRSRLEMGGRRVLRHHEVDVLGAEHGGGLDLHGRVGGYQRHHVGIHRQFQLGAVRHVFDGADAADLDAEELDLGVGFHHQPGAIRRDGDGRGLAEGSVEHGQ